MVFSDQITSPDRWDNLPEIVSSLPGIFNTLTFSAGPRVSSSSMGQRSRVDCFLQVMYRDAIFAYRNQDVPVHSADEFQGEANGGGDYQGQCVGVVHMERQEMLTVMQGADKAVHAGTIQGGKPVRAWGGAEIAGVGVTGVTY